MTWEAIEQLVVIRCEECGAQVDTDVDTESGVWREPFGLRFLCPQCRWQEDAAT